MHNITRLEDADAMAALHQAAFVDHAAVWSARAFADLLAKSGTQAFGTDDGFIMLQNPASGEAEILTLAVQPKARRQGLAAALIAHSVAALGVRRMFLEVAADNHGARRLYETCGFRETGKRKAYYKKPDGGRVDGVLMQGDFPR